MCGGGDYGLSCGGGSSYYGGSSCGGSSCGGSDLSGLRFSRVSSCGGSDSYILSSEPSGCGGGSSERIIIERHFSCGGSDGYTVSRVRSTGICGEEADSFHLSDFEYDTLSNLFNEKRRQRNFRR